MRMLQAIGKKNGAKAVEKANIGILCYVRALFLQVGSCLTPATNLPKATPLDSESVRRVRFSHFQKAERQ